ncbi:MAG TPA: AsmA family protein [Terriglobales bacterium]|nr:AsmA family protein [Terriglobales bacterium]
MRKAGIILGIVIVVVIVAALIFLATFNVNQYHGLIQSELEKRLGRQVSLGDMHLGIFPPRFQVENVSIADDPRFNSPKPFVQAQRLDVSVKLFPLLHKSVEIDSLTLNRPVVELIKDKQGVWNFASLGNSQSSTAQPGAPAGNQPQKPKPTTPAGTPSNQPSTQGSQQFSLGKLVINDGQLSLTDRQTSNKPSVYDHIDVTLKNFAPDKPFSIDAAAHMPGAGSQEVRLQGDGGPIVQSNPAATPFRGTLNLKQVGIAGLAKFANSPAMAGTDGILTGQTDINSEGGKLSAKGQMNAQNVKFQGKDLGYPVTADYDATDDLNNDLLTIRNGNIKLGPTPLQVSGTVNSKSTPSILDLNLKAADVSLTEVAKLAAATGTAFAPGTNVTGNVNANIQARGPANKPALNGDVVARNIQMSGKDIAQPVQVPSLNLKLTPTQIQSAPFNAISGGTTLNAQFALQQYLSNSPMINATLKAPNAALPAILSMAKAYGVSGLEKVSGNGTINLDMHAAGPLKSISSDSIIRAINGNMALNVANLRYTGVDLAHELGAIAGFLKPGQAAKGFTDISPLTGNILVKNGVAQTNNLQAKLDIGSIAAAGIADLASQALNMHLTAVLSKGFSQSVGGTGIGGFMKTALANNQGELAIPVLVSGTFQNPKFAPDLQQMTQMKLKGLVPNSNNPAGAVSGLLGGLLGKQGATPAPGQPQQQSQPGQNPQQNAVQQIIGIFGGKKKQQPQQNPPPK